MAAERALLDTSALVALLHRDDSAHEEVRRAFRDFRGTLLSTEAVLTESAYLLERVRGGTAACLEFFIRGAAVLVPPSRASLVRAKSIVERYEDLPADYADAGLVALAEEMETFTIFTLDRRGFSTYRGREGQAFVVLP